MSSVYSTVLDHGGGVVVVWWWCGGGVESGGGGAFLSFHRALSFF
jgi:hypothetical protein